MYLVAECFQGIIGSNNLTGIDYCILIISIFCLLTTQLRELSQAKIVSYVGLFFIICSLLLQLYVVIFESVEKNQSTVDYFTVASKDPFVRMEGILGIASVCGGCSGSTTDKKET